MHQFSSVAQLCLTLCNPMDCSTLGLPVHHQIPEFTQTHVHWVGDAIQPSQPVVPFSSCPQSLPASGSFPMSQLFAWGGQSIGVSSSASVLPINIQAWYPLEWTGWTSLHSKGLSRVSPVQKTRQRKDQDWKEVKLSLFPENLITCAEHLLKSTKKLPELMWIYWLHYTRFI